MIRFDRVSTLTDPDALSAVIGPVARVDRRPLDTVASYSASTLERLCVRTRTGEERRLILKRTPLRQDWLAYRSGDVVGREAALLDDPAFRAVWEVFACPYLAYAAEEGTIGLLMEDLGDALAPAVRAPIDRAQEDALIRALATLHARYWQSPALDRPWLLRLPQFFDVLGPRPRARADAIAPPPQSIHERLQRGWTHALSLLPPAVCRRLRTAADELAAAASDLPRTLLHGDAKVANFAFLTDERVAAFDWAFAGAGPATVDLGWYLAVNAPRLTRSKEALIACYRSNLERQLGAGLPEKTWARLMDVGLLCGARMLLWSKATALQDGRAGAREEWAWWQRRLCALLDA